MKTKGILLAILVLPALALSSACGSDDLSSTPTPSPIPTPAFGLISELVLAADHPSAMAMAPDGRLFYAEQYTGNIRIVDAGGQLLPEPFVHLDVANWLNLDWGLTGLALDPDFAANHFVYAFYTETVDPDPARPIARPKLVRFTDENSRGMDLKTINEDFPDTFRDHQGFQANGSIHFGPDGFLYATVGDYDQGHTIGPRGKPYAQDVSSPLGKMLRLDKEDGTPPPDNPFVDRAGSDPRVFAFGFGQEYDFAFHPETGQIYGTDTTVSCEELNLITQGGNYGAPPPGEFPFSDCGAGEQIDAIHLFARPGMEAGLFLSFVEVSGLEFVSSTAYSVLGDSLLVCESGTGILRRLVLGGADFEQVTDDDVVAYDCTLGVTTSPEGVIYYSNDQEIRRLIVDATVATSTP